MIYEDKGKSVCAYCGGTGRVVTERYNSEREQMEQEEGDCICQVEGSDEYNERLDCELKEEAGLRYYGKDEDGEDEWIGTYEAWNKYTELKVVEKSEE